MALGMGFHVIPLNDHVEHEPDSDCVCGPTAIPEIDSEDPSVVNFVFTHHALDGREKPNRKAG